MLECLIDGEISNYTAASNRGLNYGDGLFETLVVQNGRPRRWQAHMDRLGAGCERLGIVMPAQAILLREVQTVSAGLMGTVVKIVLTRGGAARGYQAHRDAVCVRIISAHAFPPDIEQRAAHGVKARVCDLRLAIQPALGGMKHLNRLEQVLASSELFEEDVSEGILLDREDHLISAISANIFLVMENRLLTPRLDRCGVRGVVRDQLLAAFSRRCEQRRIQMDLLHEADEVFICNSVRGIVPVTAIDAESYSIGPVTRELQDWLSSGDKA
jgi:4-amino-4-deoxychorismate lyase